MSPNDFLELEHTLRRRLQERALTELELVVVHRVLDYSYALGIARVQFKRLKFLCAVCGHRKNKISPALSRLESYEIVRVDRRDGKWTVEVCADPARWRVPMRVRPAMRTHAAEVDAWLQRINAPGMIEQPELWPEEPTLDDALFEVYRETANGNDTIDWNDRRSIHAKVSASLGRSSESDDNAGLDRCVPQKGTPNDVYCSPKGNSLADLSRGVPQKGTAPIGEIGQPSCLLSVQERETGKRSLGLKEQIDRLERVLGEQAIPYLPWWRLHAGKSAEHVNALRQSLDDLSTNSVRVIKPSNWLVKTFKNKCRAIRKAKTQLPA